MLSSKGKTHSKQNNDSLKYENIVMYDVSDKNERLITSQSGDIKNQNSNLELILKKGKM